MKAPFQNPSCGPDTKIDGPGQSRKYTGFPNIVDALSLMNLSTMAPLVFPQDLSTVVAKDFSKLTMIDAYAGVSFPTFSLLCPGGTSFSEGFIPGLATICMSLGIKHFYGIGCS